MEFYFLFTTFIPGVEILMVPAAFPG